MKRILFAISMLLFSNSVWAGIYLEPYVGYEMGTAKGTAIFQTLGTVDVNEKETGSAYGAKVGYSMLGFAFGVDYMGSKITGKDKNTPAQADSNWKGTDIGLFAQFSFPILLKVSATYFLSSKLKDDLETSGNGFKVGLGFTMLPLVSINVDMISNKYTKGTFTGDTVTSLDVKLSTIMVGLSVPLSF